MKPTKKLYQSALLGLSLVSSLGLMASARAELVLEKNPVPAKEAPVASAPVASPSPSAITTGVAPSLAPSVAPSVSAPTAPAVVVETAPALAPESRRDAGSVESKLSTSELIRRERMREEVRNEDVLQSRLEELRLRHEKKLTDDILAEKPTASPSPTPSAASAIQEQKVSPAVADRPVLIPAPESVGSTGARLEKSQDDESFKSLISFQPRLGVGSMKNTANEFIEGRFATGVGLDVSVSDNVSFELGYQFAEYGVRMTERAIQSMVLGPMYATPYYNSYGFYNYSAPSVFAQSGASGILSQNLFEGSVKMHLIGQDYKVRPFFGSGAAYGHSYLNYDQSVINAMRVLGQSGTNDVTIDQLLGQLQGGVDIQISKNLRLNATVKYSKALAARQNGELNYQAMAARTVGYYQPGLVSTFGNDIARTSAEFEKARSASELSYTSFVTTTVGLSFSF